MAIRMPHISHAKKILRRSLSFKANQAVVDVPLTLTSHHLREVPPRMILPTDIAFCLDSTPHLKGEGALKKEVLVIFPILITKLDLLGIASKSGFATIVRRAANAASVAAKHAYATVAAT